MKKIMDAKFLNKKVDVIFCESLDECYGLAISNTLKIESIKSQNAKVDLIELAKTKEKYRVDGRYGFCDLQNNKIYLWFTECKSIESIIYLIAHEIGHFLVPTNISMKEQDETANVYAVVAKVSYYIAQALLISDKENL